MQVAAILSTKGTDVATVPPTASVSEALAMLQSWGVGALVVSGDGRAIDGLISERDVVRGLVESGAGLLDRPVTEAMSTEVHTCTLTQSADDLMTTMTELRVRHLPVLDHDGALGGIISIGDVVKCRVGRARGRAGPAHRLRAPGPLTRCPARAAGRWRAPHPRGLLGSGDADRGAGCGVRRSGADDAAVGGVRRRRRGRADRPGRRLRLRLLEARRDVRARDRRRGASTRTATSSSPACGSCRRRSGRSTRRASGSRPTPATFDADILVVALGADLAPRRPRRGCVEGGHEFYTVAGAFALRDVLAEFDGGRVIVGVTSTPFKCPPAPSETALLMHDFLTERGLRDAVGDLAGDAAAACRSRRRRAASEALLAAFAERGIDWHPERLVARARPGPQGRAARRRRRDALRPLPRRAGAPGARRWSRSRA